MVGELVRRAREARGWTQTELAQRAGLRQTYISQVEGGEIALPRDHNIDKLAPPLGLSRADFYRAAGMLDGMEVAPAPLPTEDRQFDPAAIVAFVESKPDPAWQAQLARQKARRTPESYTRLCLRINRAWTSNADLVMGELEAIEQE